jgi:hypothetical protein
MFSPKSGGECRKFGHQDRCRIPIDKNHPEWHNNDSCPEQRKEVQQATTIVNVKTCENICSAQAPGKLAAWPSKHVVESVHKFTAFLSWLPSNAISAMTSFCVLK